MKTCFRYTLLILLFAAAAAAPPRAAAWPRPKIPKEQIPADMPRDVREAVLKLYDDDDRVCQEGARTLLSLGQAASSAIPFMAATLDRHRNCKTPNTLTVALKRLGPAVVEPVIVTLRVGDWNARNRALDILSAVGDERALPAIVESIAEGKGGESALRSFGSRAHVYLDNLLKSDSVKQRVAAVKAWDAFASQELAHRLGELLQTDPSDDVKLAVLQVLSEFAKGYPKARPGVQVPELMPVYGLVGHPNDAVRREAVKVIRRMAGDRDRKLAAYRALVADSDRTTSLNAIEAIATYDDEQVGKLLVELVAKSDDASIRASMAEALAVMSHPGSREAFLDLLGDESPLVRETVLKAMCEARIPGRREVYIKAFRNDGDSVVRKRAIGAMGEFNNDDEIRAVMLEAMDDPDPGVRIKALEKTRLGGEKALAVFRKGLEDPDHEVRNAAAQVLRGQPTDRAVGALLGEMLKREQNRGVRYAALLAMQRCTEPDLEGIRATLSCGLCLNTAVTMLVQRHDRDPQSMKAYRQVATWRGGKVLRMALEELGRAGDVEGVKLGFSNKVNRSEGARYAAEILAGMNSPAAERALQEAAESDPVARRYATSSRVREPDTRVPTPPDVVKRGDMSTLEALTARLSDSVAAMRINAIKALAPRLPDPKVAASLVGCLRDEDAGVRVAALDGLAGADAGRVRGPIQKVLRDDPSWVVRSRAAEVLGALKDAGTLPALQGALSDTHWYVRRAAATALTGQAGGTKAIPVLIEALKDPHWSVRDSAHKALVNLTEQTLAADPEAWQRWRATQGI